MEKQLKKEDLIEGKTYKCLLSGNTVLINSVHPFERTIMGENFKGTEVTGVFYHDGKYKEFEVYDNQLTPLDVVYTEKGEMIHI